MKKKIALLLAGVMALSTLPMSVFAADATIAVNRKGTLISNSDYSKTLFTANYPGLSIFSTKYGENAALDANGNVVYKDWANLPAGVNFDDNSGVTSGAAAINTISATAPNAPASQAMLDKAEVAANDAGYEVAVNSPEIAIRNVEAVDGAEFELILTNGVWADKTVANGIPLGSRNIKDTAFTNAINYLFDDAYPTVAADFTAEVNGVNKDKLSVKVKGALTNETVRVPFVGVSSNNTDPLQVSVRQRDGLSNIPDSTTTVASASNDTVGGNSKTTIKNAFSGKNDLEFDIVTTENVDGVFGSGRYELPIGDSITASTGNLNVGTSRFKQNIANVEKVTYTINSNFKITGIGNLDGSTDAKTLSSTEYKQVTQGITTDYSSLDVEVYAKRGSSDNKLDVIYNFGNNANRTKIASAIRVNDVYVSADRNATLGQEVTMTVKADTNSKLSDQEGIVVGNYSDYAYTSALFNTTKEPVALESGRLEFVPYTNYRTTTGSAIVADDKDVFTENEVSSVDFSDSFSDIHKTSALKVSENVPASLINGREISFELPEGVEIIGYKISNVENFNYFNDKGEDVFFYQDNKNAKFDHNVVDITGWRTNAGTDKASFSIEFYVAADANYEGDVDVVVTGGALANDALEPVTVATFAPAFKLSTEVTTVKSGVQETGVKDIVIAETENGRFLDGETVYVRFDEGTTATLRNALKLTDADITVTEGDLKVDKLTVNNDSDDNYISFKISNASSSAKPSTITLSNVKVSTAYGLPETSSYPFDINLTTDNDVNGKGKFNAELNGASIRFGELSAPYVNIKNNTGAAGGDVVRVQPDSTTYTVDGVEKTMDVAPFIDAKTSSLMVPVRFISEGVGITEEAGDLIWSANNKTVIIRNGNDTLEFPVGSNFYRINGAVVYNENEAVTQIVDGRTFVPFRTMGNALRIPVSWDDATRTAQYN